MLELTAQEEIWLQGDPTHGTRVLHHSTFVSYLRHSNLIALIKEDPKDERETSFKDNFGLQSHWA